MNYIGLSSCDTANGPGVRVSLFVSGCTLRCKGCFNPESWDFSAGKPFTEETVETIFRFLDEPYVAGLSILGGDPLEESNVPVVTDLARRVKERYGDKRDVWLWTGRIYESTRIFRSGGGSTRSWTGPSWKNERSPKRAFGTEATISA